MHLVTTLAPERILEGGKMAYVVSTAQVGRGPLADAGDRPAR